MNADMNATDDIDTAIPSVRFSVLDRGVHPREGGNDARCVIEIWGGGGNCNKFGQLIPRKIIKTVATRYHILRLKCTKFDFVWALPQTTLGSSQRSPRGPDPIAGFKGFYV